MNDPDACNASCQCSSCKYNNCGKCQKIDPCWEKEK